MDILCLRAPSISLLQWTFFVDYGTLCGQKMKLVKQRELSGVWFFRINLEIRLFQPENEALSFFLCGDRLRKARVIMTAHCCQRASDACLHVTPQVVHLFVTTELHWKQSSTKKPAIESYDVSMFPPYAFCYWFFSAAVKKKDDFCPCNITGKWRLEVAHSESTTP